MTSLTGGTVYCEEPSTKYKERKTYFPLNTGLRFWRKALTPSSLSSVAKQSAKRSTSRRRPSSRLEREAIFTASLARRTAIGPFSAMLLANSIVFASSCSGGTT